MQNNIMSQFGSKYNRGSEACNNRMSFEYNIASSSDQSSMSWRSIALLDHISEASSPWDQSSYSSPMTKSPWSSSFNEQHGGYSYTGLMGSLVREEGSIYSLATSGDLLYTGSDSNNIRVWKNQQDFSSFKSNSGLVKAISIAGEKVFTGHQDGKIRVWRVSSKTPNIHKRVGTLPTMRAYLKSTMTPSNYVESKKKNKSSIWLKHFDAISCLSLSEDRTILYSASWDKTIKIWRVADFKCLETIDAHDDAVNSVVVGFDGLVFSGSADGLVKVWKREFQGKRTRHFFSQTLLKQEYAVTALSVDPTASNLYCGSSDGLVNFWEMDRHLSYGGVLRGHKLAILCIATLRNLIFSGSADNNICVWRRDESKHICLSVLSGHTGPVKCLAVEQNEGQANLDQQLMVYSGSLDKSVKIWRVSVQVPTKSSQQSDGIYSPMKNSPFQSRTNSSRTSWNWN
ncbi:hypothetical protein LIER_17123 [Lithospermum erythrorhizon]|uniref:Uncharacterized protein n=1 Tax=Lithospermum erythrorhizon TaxID=34254 RepID=A0AAV3Q976_LITER